MEGWVKLNRNFLDWELFTIPNAFHLFVYLLMKANVEDSTIRGIEVPRGSLLTTVKKISADTGISDGKIRACLQRLLKLNYVNNQTTNKFSIITVCNFDTYQCDVNSDLFVDEKQTELNQQTIKKNAPAPLKKNYLNNISLSNESVSENSDERIDFAFISDLWNSICGSLFGKVSKLSNSRKSKIKVRITEITKDGSDYKEVFSRIFTKMTQSPFFQEKWHPTFDWIIENDKNYIKVLEGNYDPKTTTIHQNGTGTELSRNGVNAFGQDVAAQQARFDAYGRMYEETKSSRERFKDPYLNPEGV